MLLHAHRQHQAAEVLYTRARQLNPDSFRWAYYLAIVQSLQGKHADAVANLEAALELDPEYLPARLELAKTFLASGKVQESQNLYQAILQDHPESAEGHCGLGRTFSAQGQAENAVRHYIRACKLVQEFGAAHHALAVAYRDLRQHQKFNEHIVLSEKYRFLHPPRSDPFIEAVQQLQSTAGDHLRKGIALEKAGNIEEAIIEHQRALAVDPGFVQAHVNLISLYGRLNRPGEATKHYKAALTLDAHRDDLHYSFGVLSLSNHNYEQAVSAFRRTLEINTSHAEAHNNLAFIIEQQGQIDRAIHHYQSALRIKANFRLARLNLGRALLAKGRDRDAEQMFSKLLGHTDSETPRLAGTIATFYQQRGNLAKARQYFQKANSFAMQLGQTDLAQQLELQLRNLESSRRTRTEAARD